MRGLAHEQFKITRGALVLLLLELGLSLLWLFSDKSVRDDIFSAVVATPDSVFSRGQVWTLVTSPLLEIRFFSLLMQSLVLWLFLPTLERFWGTPRFIRFAILTSVVGSLAGVVAGIATGRPVPIIGLDPFMYAGMVAFGVVYARQPVRFFGAIPMTGRQLMFGILGFLSLFIILNQDWENGAAIAAAVIMALWLTHRTKSPERLIDNWRRRRKRKHLTVVSGGRKREPSQWLN